MTTVNFNELLGLAKTASFDPLPIGDYLAVVIEAEAKTASTGKPMIKVKCEVVEGAHAKRKFFNQFVLSTDNAVALAMFFRHMSSHGLTEQFFAGLGTLADLTPVAQALVGRRAIYALEQREWNGEMRNDVKAIKPAPGGAGVAGGLNAAVHAVAGVPMPGAVPAPVPGPQPGAYATPAAQPVPAQPVAAPVAQTPPPQQMAPPPPVAPAVPVAAAAPVEYAAPAVPPTPVVEQAPPAPPAPPVQQYAPQPQAAAPVAPPPPPPVPVAQPEPTQPGTPDLPPAPPGLPF